MYPLSAKTPLCSIRTEYFKTHLARRVLSVGIGCGKSEMNSDSKELKVCSGRISEGSKRKDEDKRKG